MRVEFSNRGTTLIVKILGELDHHCVNEIRETVDFEILKANNKNVIFDFSEVTFMDSSGMGMLLGRYKKVKGLGGTVAITNLNKYVKKVLNTSGVLRLIDEYEDVKKAVQNM